MPASSWYQLLIFLISLFALAPLLGRYIAHVFSENPPRGLHWLENLCYQATHIDPKQEMDWITYSKNLLIFNLFGFLTIFLLQLLQNFLFLNPQSFTGVPWVQAFNTAISFTTNTNWQSYAGESTLSYLTQMLGLTVQNFLSAAVGMAVLIALIRGLTRKSSRTIGNFWSDLVRSTVYLLLPLSLLLAFILVTQGVIQTFSPYVEITTLENNRQTIPLGPVASQVAIKQLGTNGGGFFNTNSSHPFENPTGLSNFLETLALFLIPAASVYSYGIMIGSKTHAWLIFSVMFTILACGLAVSLYSEHLVNPVVDAYPLMEGKETRFGITNSILWSITTTGTSNGSVNAMISSLTPLAGGFALFNIMLGGIVFGGIGVGMCSMIMFILLTVFLCGLMVGRTPEYLGKKIEKREIQWVMLAILLPSSLILIGSGITSILPEGLQSILNPGPHGLSEILYAFSSAAGNNGSSFAGFNANTNYFNLILGIVMMLGRIAIILPSLAIAGFLANKKIAPPSAGTFSTNSVLFGILLFCIIIIIGALTFFPALSLGPIAEHFLMLEGRSF